MILLDIILAVGGACALAYGCGLLNEPGRAATISGALFFLGGVVALIVAVAP